MPSSIYSMTINDVFEKIKETILKFGEPLPVLIVEGTKDGVVIPLQDLPGRDTSERVSSLRNYGAEMACERPVGQLQKVFLINQAWASRPKGGKLPTLPPSQDPQRQEVLLIVELDVSSTKQQSVAFELVRDKTGQLTLMQPLMEDGKIIKPDEVFSPLLPAFVQGYSIISR